MAGAPDARIPPATPAQLAYMVKDTDITRLCGSSVRIWKYPDLATCKTLRDVVPPGGAAAILFLTSPDKGHWLALWHDAEEDTFHIFDPYGIPPDGDRKWLTHDEAVYLRETEPLLRQLAKATGARTEWSAARLQQRREGVNTCGRFVIVRLWQPRDVDAEQFAKYIRDVCRASSSAERAITPDDAVVAWTQPRLDMEASGGVSGGGSRLMAVTTTSMRRLAGHEFHALYAALTPDKEISPVSPEEHRAMASIPHTLSLHALRKRHERLSGGRSRSGFAISTHARARQFSSMTPEEARASITAESAAAKQTMQREAEERAKLAQKQYNDKYFWSDFVDGMKYAVNNPATELLAKFIPGAESVRQAAADALNVVPQRAPAYNAAMDVQDGAAYEDGAQDDGARYAEDQYADAGGRAPRGAFIHLRKGTLTQYGYKTVAPDAQRQRALREAVAAEGPTPIARKLNALAVLNKNRAPQYTRIYAKDRLFIDRHLRK